MKIKHFIIFCIVLLFSFPAVANPESVATLAMKDLSGKTIRLADYKGKLVVVNFWATWCPPCLEEIPDLIRFQNTYGKKGVQVIGVNYMERVDQARLKEFVDLHGINYPIIYDQIEKVEELSRAMGGIYGLPVTKIMDRNGKQVGSFVGGLTAEQLGNFIQSLL
ncbi:MAG: TlpA family protein disulfide reductase [Magnetococcales bacterium]|nr:TlpA family protein disulfide reductase [Magnetococcales bacterium]MBF0152017.1 TlpA family protein disulfide reductase [Magnetococcales bacterium]MBF0174913.1 TlpA family protein disulfide reductase [Magnetococcales bacterium]MBF0349091.1 TlpA family protein disulfide reductase [Magnetococcales bacterium]